MYMFLSLLGQLKNKNKNNFFLFLGAFLYKSTTIFAEYKYRTIFAPPQAHSECRAPLPSEDRMAPKRSSSST